MLSLQVAFFTGQSDPRSCALTPAQAAVLDALPVVSEGRVPWNFPFDATSRRSQATSALRVKRLIVLEWS